MIKRATLFLDLNKGGLNMVCVDAKIESIRLKFLGDDIKLYESSIDFKYAGYWLKFLLHPYKIKNFNIIPVGEESKKPTFYRDIEKIAYKYKKKNNNMIKQLQILNLKNIYDTIKQEYTIKPKIEEMSLDLKSIYWVGRLKMRRF